VNPVPIQGKLIVGEPVRNPVRSSENPSGENRVTRDGFAAMAILAITVVFIVFVVVQLV